MEGGPYARNDNEALANGTRANLRARGRLFVRSIMDRHITRSVGTTDSAKELHTDACMSSTACF